MGSFGHEDWTTYFGSAPRRLAIFHEVSPSVARDLVSHSCEIAVKKLLKLLARGLTE